MYIKSTTLVSLIGVISVNGQEPPYRSPFARRVFGFRRGVQTAEEVKKEADRSPLADYERAEEEIFHHVEDFEKAAINVAHDMVHDEVDILFGKSHGHDVHDEDARNDNSDENTSNRRRSRSDRKEVKQMQTSTKKIVEEENDSTPVNTYTPSNSLWYCE